MKITKTTYSDGTVGYKNEQSLLHREDGPAYINGLYKEWRINGELHREGAPAVEYSSGSTEWYNNGKKHRIDGPAYEGSSGNKQWYYNDQLINCNSQEEFERLIKLELFW